MNILIAITGIGFTILAMFIDLNSSKIDLTEQLFLPISEWGFTTLAIAIITPIGVLLVHNLMLKVRYFHEINEFSRDLILQLNPSRYQIVALSLAAGWGEEILFRGVFQPLTGIVVSSLFFAGIHTRFKLNSKTLRHYFILVLVLSFTLGFIAKTLGLHAAIAAHSTWDLSSIMIILRENKTLCNDFYPSGSQPEKESTNK
ncbi:CPBP family intramembrane metalloprotease [bacterium]|nr:CPBP family intramembrane metalloprotease [bacterium]